MTIFELVATAESNMEATFKYNQFAPSNASQGRSVETTEVNLVELINDLIAENDVDILELTEVSKLNDEHNEEVEKLNEMIEVREA